MELLERTNFEIQWLLIPLLIVLIVLAIEKQKKEFHFFQLLKGAIKFNLAKGETFQKKRYLRFSEFLCLILLGIYFESILITSFKVEGLLIYQFLLILVFLFLYYIVKLLVLHFSGYIFEKKELFNSYINYFQFYIQAIAIISIPFLLLNILSPISINIFELHLSLNTCYFILLFMFFVTRFYSILLQGRENKISWFHLILYICTLEISPFVFFYTCLIGEYTLLN